jgi:hypothetical protein
VAAAAPGRVRPAGRGDTVGIRGRTSRVTARRMTMACAYHPGCLDDAPHLPPNSPRFLLDRIAEVRRVGRGLRFVVSPFEHTGYELGVRYVDAHGLPQRRWLISSHNRDTLEQIRVALEAQEREFSE